MTASAASLVKRFLLHATGRAFFCLFLHGSRDCSTDNPERVAPSWQAPSVHLHPLDFGLLLSFLQKNHHHWSACHLVNPWSPHAPTSEETALEDLGQCKRASLHRSRTPFGCFLGLHPMHSKPPRLSDFSFSVLKSLCSQAILCGAPSRPLQSRTTHSQRCQFYLSLSSWRNWTQIWSALALEGWWATALLHETTLRSPCSSFQCLSQMIRQIDPVWTNHCLEQACEGPGILWTSHSTS